MKKYQQDITEETVAFWRKRTGKELSHEDARDIVANVFGFFQVLAEWERKAREEDNKTEVDHASTLLTTNIRQTPIMNCVSATQPQPEIKPFEKIQNIY